MYACMHASSQQPAAASYLWGMRGRGRFFGPVRWSCSLLGPSFLVHFERASRISRYMCGGALGGGEGSLVWTVSLPFGWPCAWPKMYGCCLRRWICRSGLRDTARVVLIPLRAWPLERKNLLGKPIEGSRSTSRIQKIACAGSAGPCMCVCVYVCVLVCGCVDVSTLISQGIVI